MLSKEKIEGIEKKLTEKRAALLAMLEKETQSPVEFGDDTGSMFDEEADEDEAFAGQVALGQSHREMINDIDAALNRIKEGKYGICEQCGKEISEEVLALIPESRFCEECKKKDQ